MKILLFNLILLINFVFISNSVAANKNNLAKVGDYIIAEISSQANDYDTASQYYLNLLKKDKKNTGLIIKIIKNSLLNEKIQLANKHYLKLEKIGCPKTEIECIHFTQSIGPLLTGVTYLKKNRTNRATKAFSNIKNINNNKVYAELVRAWALANFYTYKDSIEILDSINSEKNIDDIIMHKALIYDLVNEVELADVFYQQSINSSKNINVINYYLNFLHRNNMELKKNNFLQSLYADTSFEISINNEIFNDSRLVQNQINGVGLVLYDAAQHLGFENIDLSRVILNIADYSYPDLYEVDFLSASLLHSLDLTDQAMKKYKLIPSNHYLSSIATIQLSNILNLENLEEDAIELLQNYLIKKDNFKVQMTLGDHFRYKSDWKNAQETYSKILKNDKYILDPNLWNTYYRRGISYERDKQWDLAERDFMQALELNSNQPDVLNYLGYSWIDNDINMLKAKIMIELALEQKPDDAYFIDSLAWYYFKVSNYEQADALLSYATYLAPSDPVINEHYGDALWKVGKFIEARYQWNRALDLDPEEDQIEKIKVKLIKGY
ncbi:tetratricopeptide repeat protein [Pelagibacteraceae bacterium]|nr:tetratricopeptide repeat protein [Pelagibacteraceae bacterium]